MRHQRSEFKSEAGSTELATNGTLEVSFAGRFTEKTVQVSLDGVTADVILAGTIDGDSWVDLADVTATALIQVPESVFALRVTVANWVAGTVKATLGAFDPRVGY